MISPKLPRRGRVPRAENIIAPATRCRDPNGSQWFEENRAKRCTVNLIELEQAWRIMAEAEHAGARGH
jgi:hypothetical protein